MRRALSLVLVFNVIVRMRKLRKNIKIQKLKEERELGRMSLRYQVCISHLEVVTFWQKEDAAAQQAWNKRTVCIKDTLMY